MSVNLVWVTPNAEQLIGDMARVSNPANQGKSPDALIGYMIREGHWSPFEMVNMCVEVTAPRTITRQIMRHNMRVQEFSQRYADPNALGDFVLTEARLQDPKNRQASIQCVDNKVTEQWKASQDLVAETARKAYKDAISAGVSKELARNLLPEGMTLSRCYFNGNLRDWLFFTKLRLGNGTQPETVAIAKGVHALLKDNFPVTTQAFFGAHNPAIIGEQV